MKGTASWSPGRAEDKRERDKRTRMGRARRAVDAGVPLWSPPEHPLAAQPG